MKVAFFGGSFDPPHVGHVLAAAYARARGFERVFIAPVKTHAFGKKLRSFEHRLRMAELAFAPIAGGEVSDIERTITPPNYTLRTLETLLQRSPGWSLRLMVGSDILKDVHHWYRFDAVQELAPLFVLPRSQADSNGKSAALLPMVSSTEIRAALANRRAQPSARRWLDERVPAAVLEYIEQYRLYEK